MWRRPIQRAEKSLVTLAVENIKRRRQNQNNGRCEGINCFSNLEMTFIYMVHSFFARRFGRNPSRQLAIRNSMVNIHAPSNNRCLRANMTYPVKPVHSNATTIVQYPKDSHMAGGAPPLNSIAVYQQPECDATQTTDIETSTELRRLQSKKRGNGND